MSKVSRAKQIAEWLHYNGYCPSLTAPDGRKWVDVLNPEVEPEPCRGHDLSWYYIKPKNPTIGYAIAKKALDETLTEEEKMKILRGEKLYCKGGIHRKYDDKPMRKLLLEKGVITEEEAEDNELINMVLALWLARWDDCPNCRGK